MIDGEHFNRPPSPTELTEAVARLEAAQRLLDYALQGRLDPGVAATATCVLTGDAMSFLEERGGHRIALGALLRPPPEA